MAFNQEAEEKKLQMEEAQRIIRDLKEKEQKIKWNIHRKDKKQTLAQ